MVDSKTVVLQKIRDALSAQGEHREPEYAAIRRTYLQAGELDSAHRLALFERRLRDYDAGVHRCGGSTIAKTIADVLRHRQKKSLLVPTEIPVEWLPQNFAFVRNDALTYAEIDHSEGVLTESAVAIASTGTIVLRHSNEAGGRALTLIPDYHLCLVHAEKVMETVPEGVRQMASFGAAPITMISGPSATSDIEMTRIKGVHGPRTLDVILVI